MIKSLRIRRICVFIIRFIIAIRVISVIFVGVIIRIVVN